MFKLSATLALSAVVAQPPPAAQWYGIAPDTNIPGLVNLFQMTPNGVPTKAVASVATSDYEYPKIATLHCSWATPSCYFQTGVGGPYTQDYVYSVSRTTGQTLFKHQIPAGIFVDNMAYDYIHEELWSVAFNPQANPPTAALVSWSPTIGNATSITDISQSLRGGFIFPGAFSMCPSTRRIYVGIDSQNGGFLDRVAEYDVSVTPPRLVGEAPLLFPVPSSYRAFCNATSLVALIGTTIQADSEDRETALIGNTIAAGREGLFVPIARGDLPTFQQRNQVPIFLTGMAAEFAGQMLIPFYPVFNRGPGPAPTFTGGFLWTVEPFAPGPGPIPQALSPLNYYLAGASGVPV